MANLSFVFSGSPCSQAGGIPLLPVLSSVTSAHPRSPHSSPGRCDYGAEGGEDRLLVSAQKPRPPRPESTVGSPALPYGERRPGRVNTRPAPFPGSVSSRGSWTRRLGDSATQDPSSAPRSPTLAAPREAAQDCKARALRAAARSCRLALGALQEWQPRP